MTQDEYRKIISHAINSEEEAYAFYHAVSEKTGDKSIKDLFEDLAEEEARHKIILEGFLALAPEKLRFSESKDYKVVDALPTPALTPDLKPIEGIVIAVKKELDAMQMYTRLASNSIDEGQKRIFTELASMERGHKSRLEDIYTNMAFPEVW